MLYAVKIIMKERMRDKAAQANTEAYVAKLLSDS